MRLHFDVEGNGPAAIVQSPAWGPSSDYLRQTLVPLMDGFRVVTFDPRNVGLSARIDTPDAQAVEHLVDDLERLRAELAIERFLLLGHSHGGLVSMAYAVRHPQRLSGLVLLNTSVQLSGGGPEVEALLSRMEADPLRKRAVELFRQTGGRLRDLQTDADLARHLRDLMPVYFYDLEKMRQFGREARSTRPPSVAALTRVPEEGVPWIDEGLPTVDVPALVITGRHDVVTPPAASEYICSRLPRAELAIFENSGHHPWFEEPEAFREVFADFVAQL